jgi:hypothetical protein
MQKCSVLSHFRDKQMRLSEEEQLVQHVSQRRLFCPQSLHRPCASAALVAHSLRIKWTTE